MELKFFTAGLIALTGAQSNNLCPKGYEYAITSEGFICYDVDECALGTHGCDTDHAECTNTDGNYICECKIWDFPGKRSK